MQKRIPDTLISSRGYIDARITATSHSALIRSPALAIHLRTFHLITRLLSFGVYTLLLSSFYHTTTTTTTTISLLPVLLAVCTRFVYTYVHTKNQDSTDHDAQQVLKQISYAFSIKETKKNTKRKNGNLHARTQNTHFHIALSLYHEQILFCK